MPGKSVFALLLLLVLACCAYVVHISVRVEARGASQGTRHTNICASSQ